jgi:hypothetical protein
VLAGSAAAAGDETSGVLAGALTPVGSLVPRASALAAFGCVGAPGDLGFETPVPLALKKFAGIFPLISGLPSWTGFGSKPVGSVKPSGLFSAYEYLL